MVLGEAITQALPHWSSESSFYLSIWGEGKTASPAGMPLPLSECRSRRSPARGLQGDAGSWSRLLTLFCGPSTAVKHGFAHRISRMVYCRD